MVYGEIPDMSQHGRIVEKCVSVQQTVMEKHKMNVPETMNEVLDMSDDDGKASADSCMLLLIGV